jgi:glycosyltransferase involved in cell wall biosynthesis
LGPCRERRYIYKPHLVSQIREGYENIIVHTVPEYYPYWLKFEQEQKITSKKIWGCTSWETDKIPLHWAKLLNIMDGIFVPCNWNKKVFCECGVQTRIEVLPHVSQFHGQTPEVLPSPKLQKLMEQMGERFVFYNIGFWSDRKAPWLLIEAFLSEFSTHESVALVMKTGKYDFSKYKRKWYKPWQSMPHKTANTFRKIMKSVMNGPEIIHLDEELSDSDIAWLHKRGDCFIALGRGEGWGMGSYEAAWWGKPIIITGFGGVLDYLPDNLSYHVNYGLIPVRC